MSRSPSQGRYHLSNQILDLIRDGRFKPGHHLREQQLGQLLGVSRTPVRTALKLLASQGIVEARKNQGFFLLKAFDSLNSVEIDVPSSTDQTFYERLVRDWLDGAVPVSITQSEIARRYEVDRTAMLRTLTRLAEDGLIARNRGHGWTFLPTLDSTVAVMASYDFRLTLEPAAFLLNTFMPNEAALERSRKQHLFLISHPDIRFIDNRRLFETDAEFHELMAEFSGNSFFLQAIQQQNRLRRLFEFIGYANYSRVRDWCREHLAIIDAVASGDYTEASVVMKRHLSHALANAMSLAGSPPRAPQAE